MKYKITTDGERFRLCVLRHWFVFRWWSTVTEGGDAFDFTTFRVFPSEVEATSHAIKTLGTSAERVREWRIV